MWCMEKEDNIKFLSSNNTCNIGKLHSEKYFSHIWCHLRPTWATCCHFRSPRSDLLSCTSRTISRHARKTWHVTNSYDMYHDAGIIFQYYHNILNNYVIRLYYNVIYESQTNLWKLLIKNQCSVLENRCSITKHIMLLLRCIDIFLIPPVCHCHSCDVVVFWSGTVCV